MQGLRLRGILKDFRIVQRFRESIGLIEIIEIIRRTGDRGLILRDM